MARGRLISRTLGSSRKYAALSKQAGKLAEFAQVLFPLLVANADDFGRQAGDAFTVKHAVFPTSPRREFEFSAALDAMHRVGLVQRYEVDGVQVVQIVQFDQHQPGLHKRTKSHFPGFSGKFPEIPSEEKRTELKGTEENRTAPPARREVDPLPDSFGVFWLAYPKKKSRADAEKAWRTLAPSPELTQRILAAVAAQRVTADWIKDKGKWIPYPATWINGKRWEDEDVAGPGSQPRVFWGDECTELHQGTCRSRWDHETKKQHAALLREAVETA
jgi:hypothetical protein